MAHTRQCEESVYPECACTGCGGTAHGLWAGMSALGALAGNGRGADSAPVPRTKVKSARRHLRKRAKALGRGARGNTFDWLLANVDVFDAIANVAIDAAKDATADVPERDRARLRLPSESHLVCEILAQVALALDEAIAAGKKAATSLAEDIVPDGWHGHSPLVVKALRAVVAKLLSRGVEYAIQMTRLEAALKMARIGAVTFCPKVDKHPAVKACGAPLVEEPMADGVAASLRSMASDLVR